MPQLVPEYLIVAGSPITDHYRAHALKVSQKEVDAVRTGSLPALHNLVGDVMMHFEVTPLCSAVMYEEPSVIMQLVTRGASLDYRAHPLNTKKEFRDKPGYYLKMIHFAAMGNNPRAVALLLSQGADADTQGYDNNTPLMYSIRSFLGKIDPVRETINLLLAKGADTMSCNKHHESAHSLAEGREWAIYGAAKTSPVKKHWSETSIDAETGDTLIRTPSDEICFALEYEFSLPPKKQTCLDMIERARHDVEKAKKELAEQELKKAHA